MARKVITYEEVIELSTQVHIKYQQGLASYTPVYKDIVPTFESSTRANTYPLGEVPAIQEWFNEREIKHITEANYTLINRKFESTLEIEREYIEDDQTGFYLSQAEYLGKEAAQHPDHLLGEVIKKGFTKDGLCYDGTAFFGNNHTWGGTDSLSNFQDGTGEPWVLLDDNKPVPAFFFQERVPYTMEKPVDLSEYTFMKDKYIFGIRGRCAMGYGLWQFAYGSKAELNEDNFVKALETMIALKKVNENFVGAYPTTLLVGPQNYVSAKRLIGKEFISGTNNIWFNAVQIKLLLSLTKDATPTPTPPVSDTNNTVKTSEPSSSTSDTDNTVTVDEVIAENGGNKTVRVGDVTFDVASNQLRADNTLTQGGIQKYNAAKEAQGSK